MENVGLRSVGSTRFIEGIARDKTDRDWGCRLGREEREGRMIDSPISIRWGDVSYHGPNDVESNLIWIRESLYVKTLINKLFEK